MNEHEVLETWLVRKREVSPPPDLVDAVMSRIGESSRARRYVVTPAARRPSLRSRCARLLVASAVVIVCVVRVGSLFRVLIEPTPEYSVVVEEPLQREPKDERKDERGVSRS